MIVGLLLMALNAGLVVVPIGGAVGTLAIIDHYRSINGQAPLFSSGGDSGGTGYTGGGGSSGGGGDTGNYSSNYTGWDGDKPNATTVVGGTTISEYCQQYNSINVTAVSGQNYTLNPNQWGWTASDGGGLCLNVTTNNNDTYATNTTAPKWSVTWQYDAGSSSQPVHAFPNIMIDDASVLPVKLGKLSMMRLDVKWAYADAGAAVVGTISTTTTVAAKTTAAKTTTAKTDKTTSTKAAATETAATETAATTSSAAETSTAAAAKTTAADTSTAAAQSTSSASKAKREERLEERLEERRLQELALEELYLEERGLEGRYVGDVTFSANVAVDMFFDANSVTASDTTNATYEVMVWLAQFGQYTDPIGSSDGAVTSYVVNGVNFTLYSGSNSNKQHVLTWVAEASAPKFNGSLLPLLSVLPQLDLDYYPGSTDYLGYFAFGSETYYSADNVTFDVQSLAMDIW